MEHKGTQVTGICCALKELKVTQQEEAKDVSVEELTTAMLPLVTDWTGFEILLYDATADGTMPHMSEQQRTAILHLLTPEQRKGLMIEIKKSTEEKRAFEQHDGPGGQD